MGQLFLQRQLHTFFGGRRHVLVALAEGNGGEAQPLKVLCHLVLSIKRSIRRAAPEV